MVLLDRQRGDDMNLGMGEMPGDREETGSARRKRGEKSRGKTEMTIHGLI